MTADDALLATPKPTDAPPPTTEEIVQSASQRPPPVMLEVPEAIPTLLAFAQAIAPQSPRHRSVKMLYRALEDIEPRADRDAREKQLVNLARWVSSTANSPAAETGYALLHPQAKRLALLSSAMELFAPFRARVSRLLQTILHEQSAVGLLSKVGIPGDRGLLNETIDRLSRRLMPEPVDEEELTQVVARMFSSRADAEWIDALHPALVAWFVRLARRPSDGILDDARASNPAVSSHPVDDSLGAPPSLHGGRLSIPPTRSFSVFSPVRAGLLDAILILASRASSAGLTEDIRARSPKCTLRQSPFFRLPRAIDAFLATPRHDLEGAEELAEECRSIMNECRAVWSAVLERLETHGVSVDVVYRLELIDRCLRRIEMLLGLLVPQQPEELAGRAARMLAVTLRERRRDRSLFDIVRTNTRLLARKIIERAGQTGEHYITTTRKEYFQMLFAAGGGGVLTAGTVMLKTYFSSLKRPPFQEGLLHSLNYAGGFLLMQLLGFSLATKQSSVTAAALAGTIKKQDDASELVNMIARVTRSQLAAAFGNVALVIPACLVVDLVWQSSYGKHFFTDEKAHHFLESISATDPYTAWTAALTGVLLWSSSLAAGWLENWAVYRRLPEAIAESRLRLVVGSRVTKWASRVFARNIAGFGGNVAIGFLLGLTPIMGGFLGLPFDIRHITLSAGSLTLSMLSLGVGPFGSSAVTHAMFGILVIGAMNFGVSFILALTVAMRAREVTFLQAVRMLGSLFVGFFKSPVRFFLPVEKVPEGASAHGKAH